MITLTYEELVKVMKIWTDELIASPDDFVKNPEDFIPEAQADYFVDVLNRVKENK